MLGDSPAGVVMVFAVPTKTSGIRRTARRILPPADDFSRLGGRNGGTISERRRDSMLSG
jgi:hypothetical protein